ncbi:hypothetical protein K2173_003567 [Erythroxylum novogranatense]|uniref:Late embryogenesis abundant protein LEA-2 subgroup domain-containing protein n=1 Tax=Erythroxylum novogranatense TaxID=1862640 RepID=A0AAV8TCA2_9ROSI|nr:hypothetical protein K2173_003567 [Erythroxylum novogranatense]
MENGHYQPNYVVLNYTTSTDLKPPPQRRNVPVYHGRHNSGGHCCIRCPKMPVYNVEHFEVNEFNLHQDFSLYSEFLLSVRANNPNDHIAFVYGKDSSVAVLYSGSVLCSGKLPNYRQPHNNVSVINVVLKGKSEFGSGLQEALAEKQNSGTIPLLVMVYVPISVVLKQFPMREVLVYVNCSLLVDNLSSKKDARILSSTYNYSVGL